MPGWRTRRRRAPRGARAKRRSFAYQDLMKQALALKRLIDQTPLGMAYLAGTGPRGTVCGQCLFYGYDEHPHSCSVFYSQESVHGAAFSAETSSCKRFVKRWPRCEIGRAHV